MSALKNFSSAANYLPPDRTLPALRAAAKECQGCSLYKQATQTVFGKGPASAKLVIVGEIPGKREDELGEPFVGPAGILLQDTLATCKINLEEVYFTNTVKHFKFVYENHRKIHRSPSSSEIRACKPWLDEELSILQPQIILCLGAVAAKALISKAFKLREQRGEWFEYPHNIRILATYHPSAILRSTNTPYYDEINKHFLADIHKVVDVLKQSL
jgi:DNA polymerase